MLAHHSSTLQPPAGIGWESDGNSSNCLPKLRAFLGTASMPGQQKSAQSLSPIQRPWGGWTSLAALYKQQNEALTGHWPWLHWSFGPHGAMQVFKQGCSTIRGVPESHLWQRLITAFHALDQVLATTASPAKSGPLPVCVNKVLSEQTHLLYTLSTAVFALQGQSWIAVTDHVVYKA